MGMEVPGSWDTTFSNTRETFCMEAWVAENMAVEKIVRDNLIL